MSTPACVQCGTEEELLTGIEIRGFYDGVAYWLCPCGNIIDRQGESHRAQETVPHPVHPDLLLGSYLATDFYKSLSKPVSSISFDPKEWPREGEGKVG